MKILHRDRSAVNTILGLSPDRNGTNSEPGIWSRAQAEFMTPTNPVNSSYNPSYISFIERYIIIIINASDWLPLALEVIKKLLLWCSKPVPWFLPTYTKQSQKLLVTCRKSHQCISITTGQWYEGWAPQPRACTLNFTLLLALRDLFKLCFGLSCPSD